jgi:hypothetical protein
MDTAREDIRCRPGDEVVSSDDHKLGKVVAADPRFLTVEHGLLGKSRSYVPTGAVNAGHGGKVYLNVTKEQATHAGWGAPPAVATDAGEPPRAP